jgi:hypothetical protein
VWRKLLFIKEKVFSASNFLIERRPLSFSTLLGDSMKTLVTAAACALLASAVYVNEAGAVPVTDGMSREGICNLNDVTTDAYGAANDCYGLVSGNIETSGAKSYETLLAGWGSFAGGDWTVIKEEMAVIGR